MALSSGGKLVDFLAANSGIIAASATSMVGTASVAVGAVPVPTAAPSWLPYLITVGGPVLVFVAKRVLAAIAASRRSLAASKAKRAALLRADNDPKNDAEAAKLEDEADAIRAQADALEALRDMRRAPDAA